MYTLQYISDIHGCSLFHLLSPLSTLFTSPSLLLSFSPHSKKRAFKSPKKREMERRSERKEEEKNEDEDYYEDITEEEILSHKEEEEEEEGKRKRKRDEDEEVNFIQTYLSSFHSF